MNWSTEVKYRAETSRTIEPPNYKDNSLVASDCVCPTQVAAAPSLVTYPLSPWHLL
jgi:hypothetical protein